MDDNHELVRKKLEADILRVFSGETYPGDASFIDRRVSDLGEVHKVIVWVHRFSKLGIDGFHFDATNESTVALIYASPIGSKWLLPRYMHDYVSRYDPEKYSIYPIMGQLDRSDAVPEKRDEFAAILTIEQCRVIASFVEWISRVSASKEDFPFAGIRAFWANFGNGCV